MLLSILLAAILPSAPDTLQAVTVVADRGMVVSRTDTVRVDSFTDVSSALMTIPGLYVGDYGGNSALKSMSLRGLGSAHTAIYLDGVRVGNLQSGQADLGFLDPDNISSVVVDYAQNSLSFNTARPVFDEGRDVAGKVRMSGGSFGTWRPHARVDFELADDIALSTSFAAEGYKGNFPLTDGTLRDNNDLRRFRGGVDLFIPGLHVKAYANGSKRGTPGSLSYPSTDRQDDVNGFVQASWVKAFTPRYELRVSAKGSYDKLYYHSQWGDSDYRQTEIQLNTAQRYAINSWLSASLAADLQWDGLSGNVYQESRLGTVAVAALAAATSRIKADISVEYDGTFEKGGKSWNSISPSADIRFTLLEGLDVTAFARRAYRTPTFNELYYPGYGNKDLRPEDALLTDLGIDYHRDFGSWTVKARADGFFNSLRDKIISAPSADDPMVWLPYNVGKVAAWGADLLAGAAYAEGDWKASVTARYGFQKALDKTPDSYTFDQQIPYVARHTVTADALLGWKGWSLQAVFNLRSGRVDAGGDMPAWNTLDLSAGKEFTFGNGLCVAARIIARNITGTRYEIIRDYPMPGRSLLAGLEFRF